MGNHDTMPRWGATVRASDCASHGGGIQRLAGRQRAVLQVFKGCISDVLIYRQADRRRGITSALYRPIETEFARPLRPSRIRSAVGRKLGKPAGIWSRTSRHLA